MPENNAQIREKGSKLKFALQNTGKALIASYSLVQEAIGNYVQKTFKNRQDMAKSLTQMKKIDISIMELELTILKETSEEAQAMEQARYSIKYQEEL